MSLRSAHVCCVWLSMSSTFWIVETCTGTRLGVPVLSPIWLRLLSPQHQARPPVSTAQAWYAPTAILRAVVIRDGTGIALPVLELLPNCPVAFCPQASTELSGLRCMLVNQAAP